MSSYGERKDQKNLNDTQEIGRLAVDSAQRLNEVRRARTITPQYMETASCNHLAERASSVAARQRRRVSSVIFQEGGVCEMHAHLTTPH